MMDFRKLFGTTVKATVLACDDSRTSVRSAFFKPYESPSDVLFRTTSIVTDSVFLAAGTAFFALAAGFYLLKSLANLITANLDDAKENLGEVKDCLLIAPVMLVAAIFSPVINLVDLIGGGVTSLQQNDEEVEEQHVAAL